MIQVILLNGVHWRIHNRDVKKLSDQTGSMLIECLLALTIFTIVCLVLTTAYSQALRSSKSISAKTTAVKLATAYVENLKVNERIGKQRGDIAWTNSFKTNTETIDGINYDINVAAVGNAELPSDIRSNLDIIPVRVTVSWQGTSYSVTTYYIAK